LDGIGEPGHEALKSGAEMRRIKLAEQAAEGVVTGQAMLKLEKAAQEGFFGFGKPRHRHRALAAAQGGAKRDHQQLMEIMQPGITGSRIFQTLPARGKGLQGILHRRVYTAEA
jgi:hypothetical protein